MSDPASAALSPAPLSPVVSSPRASLPADPVDGLLDRLANHLAPLFVADAEDMPAARLMAVRTIAAYQPATQADLINIGRTISFSMSALAMLGRAASGEMPPALQLRYLGRANMLSRAADQSERAMERRRRLRLGTPLAETVGATANAGESRVEPAAGSEIAAGEAAISAAVAEAIQDYSADWAPAALPGGRPEMSVVAAPVKAAPDGAVCAMPVATTTSARVPAPPTGAIARPVAPRDAASIGRGGSVSDRRAARSGAGPERSQEILMREITARWMSAGRGAELPR
jgi:hypothetical protein